MEHVPNPADFAGARAVRSATLKELGIAPICMAPGAEDAGHSHTLVEEIVVVQKGIGKIQIDNEVLDLVPGSVAVVPSGRFHALCNTGSENLEALAIFNSNVDRKKVVLLDRKAHFAKNGPSEADLRAEIGALKKANKKLKKRLRERKGK